MWSTLWLLLSSSLLAQVLAADYEMILEDSDVFEDCTDAPPGAVNIHGLMDLSDITMHLDGYKVRVEGTARTNWNIQPGDRIAGGITIMKFNRGLWEPTLLNIATQDFCKMMYNPNEYWYKYWTRFVTNAADVKDKCLSNPGNTSPLWEDFVAKASKLHTCLRAAIQAIAAYLDAFQKIADAATNSRGASKEIGTALTRVCLRHKAVETRLKSFTGAIMDCLVQPLQDKIEDWKRTVATIDKDHAKEHKRCRTELKKRSSDTLRLQKKARKGQTDNSLQSLMDSHMQDVTLRRAELEDVEKKSLRAAMIEERLRYCSFVHMLQPVVHEECEVMSELGHLQEAMQSIALVTKEPSVLPQASEELIHVAKASINLYPESPGGGSGSQGGGCSNSLGSRKSSVCSISSMNSSGSSNSPGHHHYQRSLSQATNASNQTHAVATWPPHSQDVVDTLPPTADRPHTISTTYEKGHQRPPLTVYTFQNPETIHESSSSNSLVPTGNSSSGQNTPATQKSPAATLSRPPLPVRCSSLERPLSAQSNHRQNSAQNLLQRQCPSPIPAHITKELSAAHHAQQQSQPQQQQQQQPAPTYVNTCELAAMKLTQQQQQQSTPLLQQQSSIDSISSQHSNDSSTSSLQQQLLLHQQHQQQQQQQQHMNHQQPRSHSISSASSHTASSLHSHASLDSAVATAGGGAAAGYTNTSTTTPSSGCSTPQNHYSPLLTNSPTSTAAGTPSGGSIASGLGFVYQISSPTPPPSAHEPLKITESTATVDSAEADERSRASVLQKASMFEKQAAATTAPNNVPRRSEEIRVAEQQEMAQREDGSEGRSLYADSVSLAASDTVCQQRHAYVDSDSGSAVVVIYDHQIPNTPDIEFVKQNSEIVLLRTKDPQQLQLHEMRELQQLPDNLAGSPESPDGATGTSSSSSAPRAATATVAPAKQRLSSFRASNAIACASAIAASLSQIHLHRMPKPNQTSATYNHAPYKTPTTTATTTTTTPAAKLSLLSSSTSSSSSPTSSTITAAISAALLPAMPQLPARATPTPAATNSNNTITSNSFMCSNANANANAHAQVKPCITPRPASLSGGAGAGAAAALGGSSTRIARRSSINQAKPPPPVRRSSSVTPSPNNSNTTPHTQSLHQSPATSAELDYEAYYNSYMQLHAYANSQQQQQQQQLHYQQQQQPPTPPPYQAPPPADGSFRTSSPSAGGIYAQPKLMSNMSSFRTSSPSPNDYAASTNIEKTGNIRAKTKAEFLENLNAKLAKQGMSGRAFAVRNLINSKALPDPRICHESLMDQIKRGAPLKRNQKINDRSAPKIH
ncbi:CheB38a [Drosophila busckii]|uniref:CheB38a n=1 Tax=Drosophila busckii TaxID=30019 RepID=A0A0M4EGK0_DROBS|nr:CheB38a [Drosophila busckii]